MLLWRNGRHARHCRRSLRHFQEHSSREKCLTDSATAYNIGGMSETRRTLLALLALVSWLLFMIVGDGLAMLLTLIGSAAAFISAPVLWLSGKRRGAGKLLAGLAVCWVCYLAVSTGIAVWGPRFEHPLAVGQEVCADSGCFAV